jgi:LysM repeat protein
MQLMKPEKMRRFWPLLLVCVLLSACHSTDQTQAGTIFNGDVLTPYLTDTATATFTITPTDVSTVTLQPTITSTPQIYVIKKGETLWTIAAKAGLTSAEIEAANPGINAYSLSAGMKIVVPAPSGSTTTQSAPTPTAVAVMVHQPQCTPSLTGGLYCFASVENDQTFTVKNVAAQFILTDPQDGKTQVQPALLPLGHLLAGNNLPLFAYFPPPVFSSPQVQLQLLSALPDDATDSTYLPLKIVSSQATIAGDGLSAVVIGSVSVATAASRFWVAAVAYDADGNVVAVRQLDKKSNLSAGANADFTVYVYSIGGKIDQVTVYGEATP